MAISLNFNSDFVFILQFLSNRHHQFWFCFIFNRMSELCSVSIGLQSQIVKSFSKAENRKALIRLVFILMKVLRTLFFLGNFCSRGEQLYCII